MSKELLLKTKRVVASGLAITLLAAALSMLLLSPISGQGPLAPPGPPASTMKTLDQIEARTPISSAPFFINTPGSYYLTNNLVVSSGTAITITTDNVTLDLNGFTISSTALPKGGTGIYFTGSFTGNKNIIIHDGVVSGGGNGGGFLDGIAALVPLISARVSKVNVYGCSGAGIYLGTGDRATIVEACAVKYVGTYGIAASVVFDCNVSDSGLAGIQADTVENSRVVSFGTDTALSAVCASNCSASVSRYDGAHTGISAVVAMGCQADLVSSQAPSTQPALMANAADSCRATNGSQFVGNHYGNGNAVQADAASGCWGSSDGSGNGINANVAINCYGTGPAGATGYAVLTQSGAMGCQGAGTGLSAGTVASNCVGSAIPVGRTGLFTVAAENCWGGSQNGSSGLQAALAMNSWGENGGTNGTNGLQAESAMNCYGSTQASTNHAAALAAQVAIGCSGLSAGGGAGVYATIANTCLNAGTSLNTYNCF